MKIIFMGTPEFAASCLEALHKSSNYNVVAVITQPDKQSGRGKKIVFSPVKQYALQMNIDILQPVKIRSKNFIGTLSSYNADIFVVAAYGQILPQNLLDIPKYGAINVHASLLPKYRGASPIQQAIVNGDKTTGITIMQMDKGLDTGDMLLKSEIAIDDNDTGGTLHNKLCDIAPKALLDALKLISNGQITATPQDNLHASYAPLILKKDTYIDWSKTPQEINNFVRAYNPIPGAITELNNTTLKVWKTEITNNIVEIIEITPPNGKKMLYNDYLRGLKK